jgi:Fe-S-cluster containining protein
MATRQERRALLRKAVKEVAASGISPRQGIWGTVAATRILLDILDGTSARRASEAARRAVDIFDLSVKRNPPEAPLACARGCALCCHSFVTASPPEIFLLARTIRAGTRDVAAVAERVRGNIAVTGGLGKVERFATRRACSLLVANECSAYAGRPLACRAFASFSLAACERAFETASEDIPTPAVHAFLRRACRQALWSALAAVGLPSLGYELNQALLIALERADVEARWLAGEEVFSGVAADEVTLALGDPAVRLYLEVIAAAAAGRDPPPNEWL